MATSNIEVVRRTLEAFDEQDVEASVAWTTEDVVVRSAVIGVAEGNVYRGHDGIRQWARERAETFDELRFVLEEAREVGDSVVALGHIHGRGEASGIVLDTPSGWVFSVRDGKIASMRGYLDRDAALDAARRGVK